MAVLSVPAADRKPWPTLGPDLAKFLEERSIFGPGPLKGQPYKLSDEWRGLLYRMYEVYPKGHRWAARRRFKRVGISVRKGLAKTEFMAQIAFVELHPDSPVRCDGFDRYGRPVGRPVGQPYIPLLAYDKEQVEELAYGALMVICTEGPDADLFDAGLDRIIRLGPRGQDNGKCVPLANSPNARDGARTTFQGFDEPHRLYLPRIRDAHETMVANLEKLVAEDPWGLYVGTAGQPGQNSVAEDLHREAEKIDRGHIQEARLAYFARWAAPGYDLKDQEARVAAVTEATGPAGEFGPGQFDSIAQQWTREGADLTYLERVWLNRWTASARQAFDVKRVEELRSAKEIPAGAFVTAGFDGARFRDATGIVVTDIATGLQQPWALWERPEDVEEWEVPEGEVTDAFAELIKRFELWKCYGDPPHWTETYGSWAQRWPEQFEEWWTNRTGQMARAVADYNEAFTSGAATHTWRPDPDAIGPVKTAALDRDLERHLGNAGRHDVNVFDEVDKGRRLFVLRKIAPERKFDLGMAGCLSWKARLEAVKTGAKPKRAGQFVPYRIR